jgi:prophage regulatory protein
MAEQVREPLAILRLKQVVARVGRSRSSIYADVKTGAFPSPIRIGSRSVGWLEHEISDWLSRQIAHSRRTAFRRPQ